MCRVRSRSGPIWVSSCSASSPRTSVGRAAAEHLDLGAQLLDHGPGRRHADVGGDQASPRSRPRRRRRAGRGRAARAGPCPSVLCERASRARSRTIRPADGGGTSISGRLGPARLDRRGGGSGGGRRVALLVRAGRRPLLGERPARSGGSTGGGGLAPRPEQQEQAARRQQGDDDHDHDDAEVTIHKHVSFPDRPACCDPRRAADLGPRRIRRARAPAAAG